MAGNPAHNGSSSVLRSYLGGSSSKSPTVALARQSSLRRATSSDASGSGSNGVGPPLGSGDRLVDYEALIQLFECPVCHDWVTPPIVQCRKGHIVCGPCKSKGIKACPICKQRFSDVPNWMMEQVSAVIAFPCKFQSHGCRVYSDLLRKTAHEALCSYRPVACQYSLRGCGQILLYHLMEKHVVHCEFKPPSLQHQLSCASSHDGSQY